MSLQQLNKCLQKFLIFIGNKTWRPLGNMHAKGVTVAVINELKIIILHAITSVFGKINGWQRI